MLNVWLLSGYMLEIKFVTLDEIARLVDELPLEEKEKLLAKKIKELPAESKSRVLGLSETGLTVVTGFFVSLNSDIAVNIQNSGGNAGSGTLDPETLFRALTEFKKSGSGGEKR